MSSAEESPAQKSARLRRERRQAKINEGGAARLDKITSLSGRTPAPREETSPSPSPQPPAAISSPPEPNVLPPSRPASARATPSPDGQSLEAIQVQQQQELLRSLLRNGEPPRQGQQGQQELEDDPTMKLLSSLMGGGGMPGMPPAGDQASGPGAGAGGAAPALTPELASALGLPPFVSSMLGAAMGPQTEEDKKEAWTWKVLHVIFSFVVAVYLLVLIGSSISTYGSQPPPPATVRNPFLLFTTGEVVLSGARIGMKSRAGARAGLGTWVQLGRDIVRDGSMVVFLLGMGTWWHRGWMA